MTDVRPQPMLTVRDVTAASRWYQQLLGCKSGHGGPEYEMLVKDDELILQLHHWHADEHPNMGDPDAAPHGFGVQLWFQVDDFDGALERSRGLGAEVLDGPLVNPNAKHREIWLRDLDDYTVVLSSPYGDVG